MCGGGRGGGHGCCVFVSECVGVYDLCVCGVGIICVRVYDVCVCRCVCVLSMWGC